MKKFLFLMLLAGSAILANAQSAVGVTHQGQVYNDGDTITITIPTDAENYAGIGLKNQSNSRLEGLVITLDEVSLGGIEIFAMCTGTVCIPGLVSNPIDINIRGSYNDFTIDIYNNYPEVTTPSVYTMTVANDDVNTTVVLMFKFEGVGIDEAKAVASLNADESGFGACTAFGHGRVEHEIGCSRGLHKETFARLDGSFDYGCHRELTTIRRIIIECKVGIA